MAVVAWEFFAQVHEIPTISAIYAKQVAPYPCGFPCIALNALNV